ncbi:MAG: hypothetical protein NC548_29435 [Lachnospiraceae bacterium]|nr:hypothetical protein [Lachnospiraceae bacterium]
MKPVYLDLMFSDTLRYTLRIASKVTIVTGYSAIGKTVMLEAFCDYKLTEHDSRVSAYVPNSNIDIIQEFSLYNAGSIVFVDEDAVDYLVENKALREVWYMPIYLVLISRHNITDITYGINDVFTLQTVNGVTSAVPMYPKFNTFPDCASYTCEDSESGYQYFSNYLENCTTMAGRLNWDKKFNGECLIMDAVALGSEIRDILNSDYRLFAPQSFEYLLLLYFTDLKAQDFVQLLSHDHLTYEYLFDEMCCGTRDYLGFQYSKAELPNHVYDVALIDAFVNKVGKHIQRIYETPYLYNGVCAKESSKEALNLLLHDLGKSQYFNSVFAVLPDILEQETFVSLVIHTLNSIEAGN